MRVSTQRGSGDAVYLLASRIGSSLVVNLDAGGYHICDPQKATPIEDAGPRLIVDNR